ncbi:MAG: hypothetical protein JWO69_424 [Thermoleophilia bacterium]|jgi:prepilin-type N-terminal cleavage/methylation domain-containing protein|nr:hypothetical protein [Thermoleophilia bacterium]
MHRTIHISRRVREHGFTLIEVIIALVLFGVVLAFISRPFMDGVSGANKGTATAVAERVVGEATDRFRTDVQAALAPDRDQQHIRDASKLQRALTDGSFIATSDDPAALGMRLDVADIVDASPTRLVLRADVVNDEISPGSECVTWEASLNTSPRFSLQRTVRGGTSAAACSAGPIRSQEWLVRDVPRAAGVTYDNLFRYGVLQPAPGCRVVVQPAAPAMQRHRVVAIDMRLSAIIVRGGAASEASDRDLVAIRSHDSADYRRALGC